MTTFETGLLVFGPGPHPIAGLGDDAKSPDRASVEAAPVLLMPR
jgi:hypothetical protein